MGGNSWGYSDEKSSEVLEDGHYGHAFSEDKEMQHVPQENVKHLIIV